MYLKMAWEFGIMELIIPSAKQIKMLAIGVSIALFLTFTVGIGAIDPVNKNIYSLIESNNKIPIQYLKFRWYGKEY